MQYIFGDNRNRYAVIYTDGKQQEAEKLNSLLRFSITPNEQYNTLGFLTHGINSNCPLFFEIKKDKTIPRSCYFTHAFSREADPAYFGSEAFMNDLFVKFATQDEFDKLRDGTPEERVAPALQADLQAASLADRKELLDSKVLRETVTNLYQKNKVLLAIEDEQYSDALVRVLLKQIYTYLTPSLRKATSFLSAKLDADVTLRIVPKSMVADARESYLLIDGSNFVSQGETVYHQLADYLLEEGHPARRSNFYSYFEVLFSGYDSVYKKQNMEDLFRTLVLEKDVLKLEKIVDSYLQKHSITEKEALPEFIAKNMTNVFAQEAALANRFVLDTGDVLQPAKILSTNNLFFYKVMLFSDVGEEYLKGQLIDRCRALELSMDNFEAACNAVKTVQNCASDGSLRVQERYFYTTVALPVYQEVLLPRLKNFGEMKTKAEEALSGELSSQGPIEPSKHASLKEQLVRTVAEVIKPYCNNDPKANIGPYLKNLINQQMEDHNQRLMSGAGGGAVRYPNEVVLKTLADIEGHLEAKRFTEVQLNLISAFNFPKEYHFAVDNLAAVYMLREFNNGRSKNIEHFQRTKMDPSRMETIIRKVAAYDLAACIALKLTFYVNKNKAASEVLEDLKANCKYVNTLTFAQTNAFIDTVCKAIEKGSNDRKELAKLIEKLFKDSKNEESVKKGTNLHRLLACMAKTCKTGAAPDLTADGKLKNILLAVTGGIAAIAIAISLLFVTGVLGGSSKDADDGEGKKEPSTEESEAGDQEGSEDVSVSVGESEPEVSEPAASEPNDDTSEAGTDE